MNTEEIQATFGPMPAFCAKARSEETYFKILWIVILL